MNNSFPFDPIKRSKDVESLAMQGDKRRYYRFRFAKFYGGIVTADAVGCNLLCAYCWNFSRNLNPANAGDFYSLIEVAEKLQAISEKNKSNQFRISGAEPILRRTSALHPAKVIKLVDGNFVIECPYNPARARQIVIVGAWRQTPAPYVASRIPAKLAKERWI